MEGTSGGVFSDGGYVGQDVVNWSFGRYFYISRRCGIKGVIQVQVSLKETLFVLPIYLMSFF